MSKQLYFIALLPSLEIQEKANQIKHYFAEVYQSKAALKSPPHITLQPPFYWEEARIDELQIILNNFAQYQVPIPITLNGFAAFKPRVIYINVQKTPELIALQKELMQQLELNLNIVHQASKNRPFAPHITVGFKDLSKANFYLAWSEFKEQKFDAMLTVEKLTLLQFNGQNWDISSHYYFY